MKLSPKQRELYNVALWPHWIAVVCGTIRSGKSLAGLFGYLRYVMTTFNNADHIVACYSDMVWQGTVLKYAEWFCRLTKRQIRSTNKGFTITALDPTGRVITNKFYRVTARDVSSIRRVQGMGDVQTVWATEVALYPPGLISEFVNRLANAPVETRRMILDCNPEGGPQYWFKTDWIDAIKEGKVEGMLWDDFGPEDNPDMTPEKWKTTCDAIPDGPEKVRKTQGFWVADAGLVFDLDKWGVVIKPPRDKPRVLDVSIDCADSGITHALLVAHYATYFCVVDYYEHSGRLSPAEHLSTINKRFSEWGKISRWVADVNAGMLGTLRELERSQTVTGRVHDPYKQNKDLRIQTTNRMLQRRILRISTACKPLIRECGRFSYNPKHMEEGEDVVIKKYDHGPDALMYWVMMHTVGAKKPRPIVLKKGRP